MPSYINGKEEKAKLLEDLIKVITENNEVSSQLNQDMIIYTKWLFWLTLAIGFLALIQALPIIKSMFWWVKEWLKPG